MKDYQNSRANSHKDIFELARSISNSISIYQNLKTTATRSHEKEVMINQLATMLEDIFQNYNSAIRNYRLLTYVYEQTSKQDIMKISKNIARILKDEIKDPSKAGEIDVKEYTRLSQEISALNQRLQSLNQSLATEVNVHQESWLDKIKFVRQILRIPDLANELGDPEDLLSCMKQVEDYFENLKNSQNGVNIDALKKDWSELGKRFAKYKDVESYEGIKRIYGLSDETIVIIKGLLNEEEIPLLSISPKVLKELYEFKDFCRVITLKFKPVEETTDEI